MTREEHGHDEQCLAAQAENTAAQGVDYTFTLEGMSLGMRRTLALTFDGATGTLAVENNDPASNSYTVAVERVNLDGSVDSYQSETLDDGAGVGVLLDVGSGWDWLQRPDGDAQHDLDPAGVA